MAHGEEFEDIVITASCNRGRGGDRNIAPGNDAR